MRSANFHLMGDVSEGDLRRVAGRLEQFRAAVGRLLPKASVTTATPTTVMVFRSHRNYQPFKPIYNGSSTRRRRLFPGCQPPTTSPDHRDAGRRGRGERYGIIYHELVHLMVNNTVRGCRCGSTKGWRSITGRWRWRVTANRSPSAAFTRRTCSCCVSVHPGRPARRGRSRSPFYNEREKTSIFYAESWALVHYLLLGQKQRHTPNAASCSTGWSTDCRSGSVSACLGISSAQFRKNCGPMSSASHSRAPSGRFPSGWRPSSACRQHPSAMRRLTHRRRARFAMGRRTKPGPPGIRPVARAPANIQAHSTLGMLYAQAGQVEQARTHLEKAAGGGATAQTLFQLAETLQRRKVRRRLWRRYARIEAALRQAIASTQVCRRVCDLARVLAARPGTVTRRSLLQKAIALSPGREDYMFNLGMYLANRQQSPMPARCWTHLRAGPATRA